MSILIIIYYYFLVVVEDYLFYFFLFQVLEKMRPIDQKLKYQIDKVIKKASVVGGKLSIKIEYLFTIYLIFINHFVKL